METKEERKERKRIKNLQKLESKKKKEKLEKINKERLIKRKLEEERLDKLNKILIDLKKFSLNKEKNEIIDKEISISNITTFDDIKSNKNIYLVAGENFYNKWKEYNKLKSFDWYGIWNYSEYDLANSKNYDLKSYDIKKHNIYHNLYDNHNLLENSVDIYQSEDVFEHLEYDKLLDIINDIYRILKPKGLFRLSLPDYNQLERIDKCLKNKDGEIYFDEGGGGEYKDGKVINGGHLWFPTIKSVKKLLCKSNFKTMYYLQYYDENNVFVYNEIDYRLGYVKRSYPIMTKHSIVVDCYKF